MGIERLKEFWPDWEIVEPIGTGAFGKVYKAVNNEAGFPAYSAIKVISIPSSEAEIDALRSEGVTVEQSKDYFKGIADDFVNEIKLMLTLKGAPNIVTVDTFKIAEKTEGIGWDIFIRMELLYSFKDYLDEHTPTEKEIIKIGTDIANALEICQQKHIIHRDIKPANIFVDSFGNFKLGDFGIAKELEKTTGAISSKGTFSYMAPEVAHGQRYDSTVDIYSLGLVMYSLLNNNKPPFVDPYSSTLSFNERKAANDRRLSGEPLPPPCNASPILSDVILTACAYDPDKRFKSAKAFKNVLQNYNSAPKYIHNIPTSNDLDETIVVSHDLKNSVQNVQVECIDETEVHAFDYVDDKHLIQPERAYMGRLLPHYSNRITCLLLAILLFLTKLLLISSFQNYNDIINTVYLGLSIGIFACITFYYPLKHSTVYYLITVLLHLLLIFGYLGEHYNANVLTSFNFIIPFTYLSLKDTSKKKRNRSLARNRIIVFKSTISNYIFSAVILIILFIIVAIDIGFGAAIIKALAEIQEIIFKPDFGNLIFNYIIRFIIKIPIALFAFTLLFNLTVRKHIKQPKN